VGDGRTVDWALARGRQCKRSGTVSRRPSINLWRPNPPRRFLAIFLPFSSLVLSLYPPVLFSLFHPPILSRPSLDLQVRRRRRLLNREKQLTNAEAALRDRGRDSQAGALFQISSPETPSPCGVGISLRISISVYIPVVSGPAVLGLEILGSSESGYHVVTRSP